MELEAFFSSDRFMDLSPGVFFFLSEMPGRLLRSIFGANWLVLVSQG